MAALAASSSSHSLVECVGLRPCEDGPRLAEPRATSPVVSPNRWMAGLYAPLPEEVTSYELDVVGELPPELEGRYLRNGPNPVGPVDPASYHWFTGDAMVHGLRLRDGGADWYRARYVRSTAVGETLGEEPAPGDRHSGMDTASTNGVCFGGSTFALVEAGARPVELSYELDTVMHSDLGGTLPNGYTAHPKVDPATGDLHAVAYHWAIPHLQYIVIGADGLVRQVEPIEVADGQMVHDCSINERWLSEEVRRVGEEGVSERGFGGWACLR